MKKALFTLIISSLCLPAAFACGDHDKKETPKTTVYLSGGYKHFNLRNVNEQFGQYGLATLNPHKTIFGPGATVSYKRLVLGTETSFFCDYSEKHFAEFDQTQEIETVGGYGYVFGGYKIIKKQKFSVFPMVGAGLSYMNVKTMTPAPYMPEVDNFATRFNSAGAASMLGMTYTAGLGADFLPCRYSNLVMGVRTGYNITGKSDWKINGKTSELSPQDNLGGFFGNMTVGYMF